MRVIKPLRNLVSFILTTIAIKILTSNISSCQHLSKLRQTSYTTKKHNISEEEKSPPLTKDPHKNSKNYKEILKEKNIIPINHRKVIPQDIHCPTCSAPVEYIYSNAVCTCKKRNLKIQKYKCKM